MSESYFIKLAPGAERQFRKLPRPAQERLRNKIDSLARNPRPHGAVKMVGEESAYRIRVGDWRIVYEIDDAILLVLVVRIGDRKDVYR